MPVFRVILVRIFSHFPPFGLNTERYFVYFVSLRVQSMRENVGKMRTRITPNTDTFYALNVTKKAKSLELDQPKLLRKRGGPKKLEDFYGFGPAKPAHLDESKDLYRKHNYEAFDHVINCIEERFSH